MGLRKFFRDLADIFFGDWGLGVNVAESGRRIPERTAGTRPNSIRICRKLLRYHPLQYAFTGVDWWRMFETGPWKWDSQQRFAGVRYNPGHFFGITRHGADAEAAFYKLDPKQTFLLSLDVDIDNVLDLTNPLNIRNSVLATVVNPEDIAFMDTTRLLSWVLKLDRGGNEITDNIGRQAFGNGYAGILFFSARALSPEERSWIFADHPLSRAYFDIDELACSDDRLALVIFSMRTLLQSTSSYNDPAGNVHANPYRAWAPDQIEKLSAFNSEYQLEQFERSILVRKTRFEKVNRTLRDDEEPW